MNGDAKKEMTKEREKELLHHKLLQQHQQELKEQEERQKQLQQEKLQNHMMKWGYLSDGLQSDDLSTQLKTMEELLELSKTESIVPAVIIPPQQNERN